jgi:hypothetical protein
VVLSVRGNIILLPILLKMNPRRSWGTTIKASRRGSEGQGEAGVLIVYRGPLYVPMPATPRSETICIFLWCCRGWHGFFSKCRTLGTIKLSLPLKLLLQL